MKAKGPIEYPVSAGGVVYRRGEMGEGVALCGQRHPLSWRLPKGTPNPGESLEETAIRETVEETGLRVRVEAKVGHINYRFVQKGVRYHKTVHFFLMVPIGGDVSLHDPEFDEVRWFSWDEAATKLTYKEERDILNQARALLSGVAQ